MKDTSRIVAAFFLFVVFNGWAGCCLGAADEGVDLSKIDGHDWVKWPEHTRPVILLGVVAGMNMNASEIMHSGCRVTCSSSNRGGNSVDGDMDRFFVSGVSLLNLVYALNKMYADADIRGVAISDAVYFAVRWIRGFPQNDLERILEYLKRGKTKEAHMGLVVKDHAGSVVRVIDFP